jgi:hypothetical protein
MPRKARGTKSRLASPAQMARLETLLERRFSQPLSFPVYRHWLREYRQPDRPIDTREAPWAHLEDKDTATSALVKAFSQALHEARLARDAQEAP